MSVEEIFQLIQCRGSVTQEKKEVDLGRLRVLLSQNKVSSKLKQKNGLEACVWCKGLLNRDS